MASDTRHKQERANTDAPVQRTHSPSHETNRNQWNRSSSSSSFSPFSIMRQGLDEMERWFGHVGRGWTSPSANWMAPTSGRGWMSEVAQQFGDWTPAIEAFQRGNEFVVRAEVPGMTRQDLTVEAGDDSITIRGERKHERDEDREGVFWSERSYGSFSRTIPLPPGTISDSAKATFSNGILEIVMQAPSAETRRGRRIDISGAAADEKKTA